ncbi:MAG: peptide ABC transporter substrate-binding protein, partial [Anaerolineae bacterium]|nr:peptide ABC transporter substrate-binding protein [Anaerolineae bacterium]
LKNFKPDPTEYYSANADQWELAGSDTVVIGFTQEPATMYDFGESAAVQRTASQLVKGNAFTQYSYGYQADMVEKLPNLKDGDAKLNTVEVKAGDKVYDADGNVVELKAGVKVVDVDGKTVEYKDGTVKMPQMVVTFKYKSGLKWSDGEPLKKADFELFWKIRCDPESQATTYTICDFRQKVEAISDTEIVHTHTPGVLDPTYFLPSDQEGYPDFYPSHQKLADGRLLKDVPAKEFLTIPEIAEKPLGVGPWMIQSWTKGQNMTLVANPNYYKAGFPKVKKIVIQFVADSTQAVAQLLTGDIDIVGKETVGAGTELETILKAAGEGKIQAEPAASPTWEHIDMNMFTR